MVRFSLRKIMNKVGNSSTGIITALKAHCTHALPRNRRDPIYKYYGMDFSGDSFLLNPFKLFQYEFKYSQKEIAHYICLASLRSFNEYTLTSDATLDLFHSPMEESIIQQNKLLKIENGRIHFLFE